MACHGAVRENEVEGTMRRDKFRGNIFVANLPKGYTDADLARAFDPYGLVLGAFLARDPATGEPKQFGLVDIAPATAAKEAVEALNGTEVGNQRIKVKLADPDMALNVPRPPRPPRPAWRRD
jgi:RNA recognition motif-containing protein